MNKLEQAARQAEEWFAWWRSGKAMWTDAPYAAEEILTALREALDHFRDATKMVAPDGYALISVEALKAWGKYDEVRNACQFPAEQAEQEPVAEVVSEHTHGEYESIKKLVDYRLPCRTKLYAAPVQQVDLTDDEIKAAYESWWDTHGNHAFPIWVGAKAVIAAYKEKNK